MQAIPYARPYPWKVAPLARALRAMSGERISNGDFARRLETRVAGATGYRHAVATSSCTMGLHIALRELAEMEGATRVIMPAFTWKSTAWAARAAHLSIAFSDIDRATLHADIGGLSHQRPQAGTTLYVPVDTFGSIIPIPKAAASHTVVDAAHSLGAPGHESRRARAVVFSMSPSKVFTACEGGVICTDDAGLAARCAAARDWLGRMSEPHAAIGIESFRLVDLVDRRAGIVRRYREGLGEEWLAWRRIPVGTNDYVIPVILPSRKDRDAVREALKGKVEFRVYFEPLERGHPATEEVFARILCLPAHPTVDVDAVVVLLRPHLRGLRSSWLRSS